MTDWTDCANPDCGHLGTEHAATGPCLVGSRPGSYDAECLCDEFEGAADG